MDLVEKRLHVSGLTPQISKSDLESRFKSFGTVKALDEFGKLDGNGFPRPYAFVTLQAPKTQLSKCMNLLSGTMWKGAKLRIGEAKQDFRQRYSMGDSPKERSTEETDDSRPKKKKRLLRGCQGTYAADMSLVTTQNLSAHPGWQSTPLGRLVRPLKMRPSHPLHEPDTNLEARAGQKSHKTLRSKQQRQLILTRVRRRIIDPLRFGSTYMKGVLLDSSGDTSPTVSRLDTVNPTDDPRIENRVQSAPEETDAKEEYFPDAADPPITHLAQRSEISPPATSGTQAIEETADIAGEASRNIALLNSLFADRDEWDGRESLSDVDMGEVHTSRPVDSEEQYEDIPMVPREPSAPTQERLTGEDGSDEEVENGQPEAASSEAGEVQAVKLKDLFASRAVDAGFSLMGNLNEELELDDSLAFLPDASQDSRQEGTRSKQQGLLTSYDGPSALTAVVGTKQRQIQLNPAKPLFFPTSLDTSGHFFKTQGRVKDVLLAAKERGLAVDFYRTDNSEAIKKRWEETKVELTRQWKSRHREAVKSMRRRGGNMARAE